MLKCYAKTVTVKPPAMANLGKVLSPFLKKQKNWLYRKQITNANVPDAHIA
jgi:hypothetical protein